MIYEFIRAIKEMGHCVRHFFRALTCEHYYVRYRCPLCNARSEVVRQCEWYWCPKREGGDTE
jgi:hypothetical protein